MIKIKNNENAASYTHGNANGNAITLRTNSSDNGLTPMNVESAWGGNFGEDMTIGSNLSVKSLSAANDVHTL